MASGATSLEMGLVIRLHGITLGAPLTHPLLLVAVLPPVVLLDPNEVAERVAGVVVEAGRLRAHEHPLPRHCPRSPGILPLEQLPRHLVPPTVHLEVLVPLEPLVADLAHVAVRLQ